MRNLHLAIWLLSATACDRIEESGVDAGTSAAIGMLDSSPCTAVSLAVPSAPFAVGIGEMIPLAATAVCPPGQVGAFQFWAKQAADPNWTILNNFGVGPYSFVPPIAGTWCVSAVVRSADSSGGYQARSGSVCGTVGGASVSPISTLVVPVVAPGDGVPDTTLFGRTFGVAPSPGGSTLRPLYVPLAVSVGTRIRAIRARVRDSGSGTKAQALLMHTADDAEAFLVDAITRRSTGTGIEETVDASGLAVVAAPATHYIVEVVNTEGSSASVTNVYRLEVDTN